MRKFGNDSPEFLSFQLGDDEKVYKIPLAASMPISVLVGMGDAAAKGDHETMRYQLEVLKRYMGEDADNLTAGQMGEIFSAWVEESNKQGAEPGEL